MIFITHWWRVIGLLVLLALGLLHYNLKTYKHHWLVVSNMFFFHNIWDNPSHWLIFFKMVKTPTRPILRPLYPIIQNIMINVFLFKFPLNQPIDGPLRKLPRIIDAPAVSWNVQNGTCPGCSAGGVFRWICAGNWDIGTDLIKGWSLTSMRLHRGSDPESWLIGYQNQTGSKWVNAASRGQASVFVSRKAGLMFRFIPYNTIQSTNKQIT